MKNYENAFKFREDDLEIWKIIAKISGKIKEKYSRKVKNKKIYEK